MRINNNELFNTLIIALTITVTTLIGLLFVQFYDAAASLWPAAGFYAAFYFLYGKKVLPGLLIGIFITNFIFRLAVADEIFFVSLIISIIFVLGNFIEMYLFRRLVIFFKTNSKRLIALEDIFKFVMAVLIATMVGAFVSVSAIFFFYGKEEIGTVYLQWTFGNFVGMVIFAALIINSHYHDVSFNFTLNKLGNSIIYIISFVAISLITFGGYIEFVDFMNYQLLFVILYVVTAFVFSFRMIIFNNLVFFILCYVLYLKDFSHDEIGIESIKIVFFIVSLSSISSLVKMILVDRQNKYKELDHAHNNLEKIIISTNDLFNIKDQLPEDAQKFTKKYLKNMFNIACDIYPKFERASCYIRGERYVEFIDAHNYDVDFLNSLNFDNEVFIWNFDQPAILYNTNNDDAFNESIQFKKYHDKYGVIRESIRFTVFIGAGLYGGMSFDIIQDTSEKYNDIDVENFRSFQNLLNSYYSVGILNSQKNNLKDDIVLSLVRTLELYDSYTGGHSEEVANLSVELAKELQLKPEEIRLVYWSAIVHDIGKVGLSNSILNKKGKLTDEEYEEVKKHPVYGYNILSQSRDLKEISKTVLHHHEWWNGKGYPDGIRGIDIPYSSQILHVCDAVSAMAKDRIYRKALNEEEIIGELKSGLGKQFSPKVGKYMVEYINEGKLKEFYKKNDKK